MRALWKGGLMHLAKVLAYVSLCSPSILTLAYIVPYWSNFGMLAPFIYQRYRLPIWATPSEVG